MLTLFVEPWDPAQYALRQQIQRLHFTCLDVFSGTGCVGRVLKTAGWTVVSLDMDAKFRPTICEDFLEWEPEGAYDYIHFSPPCELLSRARTTALSPPDMAHVGMIHDKIIETRGSSPSTGQSRTRPLVSSRLVLLWRAWQRSEAISTVSRTASTGSSIRKTR